MMTSTALLFSIVISACSASLVAANYQDGEFVPTARRAQFHGVRTTWHDLLGRHCPRFGQDRVVAVPLPYPKGQHASDDYKISFSFDHDRLVTHWLRIIGKHAPAAPLIDIELTQRADVLASAKAKVLPIPKYYLWQHQQLLNEFQNSTHWPKHLLVRYHWKHNDALNVNAALYVLFGIGPKCIWRSQTAELTAEWEHVGFDVAAHCMSSALLSKQAQNVEQCNGGWHAGILTSAMMAVNVIVNYQQKLSEFLAHLATESSQAGNVQKAE